ncbi:hypothetical protein BH23PLA1_BH23PLA1_33560 [soil metagenome]
MKNLTWRFVFIAVATVLGAVAIYGKGLTLGIDLSGGTILVYEVDKANLPRGFDMDELTAALKRRINPDGVYDITIREVGGDRVEIIMPSDLADKAEEVKRKLTEEGSLEFRILASTDPGAGFPPSLRRIAGTSGEPLDELPAVPGVGADEFDWAKLGETVVGEPALGEPTAVADRRITDGSANWVTNRYSGLRVVLTEDADFQGRRREVRVRENTRTSLILDQPHGLSKVGAYAIDYNSGPEQLRDSVRRWPPNRFNGSFIELQGLDDQGNTASRSLEINRNTEDELILRSPHGLRTITSYTLRYNPSEIGGDPNLIVRSVRVPNQPGMTEDFILFRVPSEAMEVTGENLANVFLESDPQMRPAVGFELDGPGARRFGNLTGRYRPKEEGQVRYHLAIVLDGEIMSAPYIQSRITDRGIITMGGGREVIQEVNFLIDILKAGSLPVALITPPLQEEKIGPTLGEDTIRKGVFAIAIAFAMVPLFMIVYYRFAGVVAVTALTMNMILLLGTMAWTESSITLPGLAGLALTIGMAVDANVLIFERMREERDRGANLAQQIRNGFGKAWSTIFDSNVTTVLSALVLFTVGTEEVKGFALVLIIGLIWNLFTAVYVSRTIFEFAYQRGWLRKLTMMRLLDKTNINFIGPRRYCIAGSLVAIAIGLSLFFNRGGHEQTGDMYNIDFTGGTLVTVRIDGEDLRSLPESQRVARVRSATDLPNVAVESLNVEGSQVPRYNIRTTEADAEVVQRKIREGLGDDLVRLRMQHSEPATIAEAESPEAVDDEDDELLSAADAFAGGNRYHLTLNIPQAPSEVAQALQEVLISAGVADAANRFEIVNPQASPAEPDAPSETLVLNTNLDPERAEPALAALEQRLYNDPDFLFERLTNFGSVVADEMRQKAVIAIVLSWFIIIGYLWLRFKSASYGVAAVIALIHDVLIALGAVALVGYKIDLPMIAAFLTLIGFSVNDTILIFDRIREIKGKSPVLTPQIINQAINVTLNRTILTSLTTWMVVLIFYLFGGEGLAGFSFCLVVGFLSGTYSTIYIAAPILIEWLGKPSGTKPAKETAVASR